ncbi:MAG: hypothetical protein IPK07_05015 [Deltaproteobacteria bacterium]|nr:hypothetical protein [Deltaproteobacteria bacterium]
MACTEDLVVAEAMERAGAFVPGLRPAALAADGVPLDASLRWVVDTLAARFGVAADVVVTVSPSHPVRSAGLVDRVVGRLLDERRARASTWARLGGRPEEWLEPSGVGGYRFFLDGDLGARVRRGDVTMYRTSASVAASWLRARDADGSGPTPPRGGWVGELLGVDESLDADDGAASGRAPSPSAASAAATLEQTLPPSVRHPDVRVVLAPPIGASVALSTREHWLARAQRCAARLTPAPACVVGVDAPRLGLLGLAAQIEARGLVQRGAVAVLLDTRFPALHGGDLARAIANVQWGQVDAQVGLLPSADRPTSTVAVEDGLARAVAELHPHAGREPVLEPAGFLAWRSGRFPFEIVRHRLATSFACRLDGSANPSPAADPGRPAPSASETRMGPRSSEEMHP